MGGRVGTLHLQLAAEACDVLTASIRGSPRLADLGWDLHKTAGLQPAA